MQTRALGSAGLAVSAVGLGCMPMSSVYGAADDEQSVAAIHRALELGMTLLDTADVYGNGHNEELVGRAIRGRRDETIVATKFGWVLGADPPRIDCRPESVQAACEASLRRLGIETIDLYQQHRVDPEVPIEETIGALAQLVQDGKVRYIGLSEAMPADIRRAHAVHPVSSLQSEYSLLERGVEREVLPTCAELGIGFLPFAPLSRGVLSGSLATVDQLTDGDSRLVGRFPRVGPDHLDANAELAKVVAEIAAERGVSRSQVALAWLLSRGSMIVPIPGTKRASYVEDNAGAPEVRLTAADEERLDVLAARVSGERYSVAAPTWVSPPPAS